ncbi:MAG TPA: tetratricopeptide repeat protein, partial [Spirochaetes bacterium]|nr:tetratricopeptide repeat protein [Spirochaetota bacterium]
QKDKEYYHQGIAYFKTGEFDQAEHVLGWIKKDFPIKSKLNYYKGMISWALKKQDLGLKLFQQSIQEDREFYMPYISLAKAFQELNQPEKGLEILKDYMDKFPKSSHIIKIKQEYSKMLRDIKSRK